MIVQAADHADRKAALAVQDFGNPRSRADQWLQVLPRKALLLHAKLDRLDRIGPEISFDAKCRQPDVALPAGRQFLERIDDGNVHRGEMARISRQDCQIMPVRRCSNGNVGKAWSVTAATGPIRQGTGNLGCRAIEGQDAVAIEVQHGSQPCRQMRRLPFGSLALRLRDALGDLRNRDR